jgi:hypothetical protein
MSLESSGWTVILSVNGITVDVVTCRLQTKATCVNLSGVPRPPRTFLYEHLLTGVTYTRCQHSSLRRQVGTLAAAIFVHVLSVNDAVFCSDILCRLTD